MVIGTPDKTLLLLFWNCVKANGRTPQVKFTELAERIRAWQAAGIRVYPTDSTEELRRAVGLDARLLAELGFLRVDDESDTAELTGPGEMIASTLELPAWARHRLADAEREREALA